MKKFHGFKPKKTYFLHEIRLILLWNYKRLPVWKFVKSHKHTWNLSRGWHFALWCDPSLLYCLLFSYRPREHLHSEVNIKVKYKNCCPAWLKAGTILIIVTIILIMIVIITVVYFVAPLIVVGLMTIRRCIINSEVTFQSTLVDNSLESSCSERDTPADRWSSRRRARPTTIRKYRKW